MQKILHKAFAKFLTDVADKTITHPAIIEDYKKIFNKGKYVSTIGAPVIEKTTQIQREAKKRIDSMLDITTTSVDAPTVLAKATDSSLLLSNFKLELDSLKKKAELDSERVDEAKKAKEILSRELFLLTTEESTDTSKKLEASDEKDVREKQRRMGKLKVEIKLNNLMAQAAELEELKTKADIAAIRISLQTVQEESPKGETSNIVEAPRTTISRRNSGTVSLFFNQTKSCFWCLSESISA
jgi:hypothetical protein